MSINFSRNGTATFSYDNLPLQISFVPAYEAWTIAAVVNCLACLVIGAVFYKIKPMNKDTRFVATIMNGNDLLNGLATICISGFHLCQAMLEKPETDTPFNCLFMPPNIIDLFTMEATAVFQVTISFDRFFAAVFPIPYHKRSHYYRYYLTAGPFIYSCSYCVLSLFNISREPYAPICLLRYSLNGLVTNVHNYGILCISLSSVFLYAVAVITLKVQIHLLNVSGGDASQVRKRIKNKAMNCLGGNALAHLCTSIAGAFGAIIVSHILKGVNVAPYFTVFWKLSGLTSLLIYYFGHAQFRAGTNLMFKNCFKCSNHFNQVGPSS